MTQDELDLMQDALLLLSCANGQDHTVMWQKAKRNVLARAGSLVQQPDALGLLVRIRFLSNGE